MMPSPRLSQTWRTSPRLWCSSVPTLIARQESRGAPTVCVPCLWLRLLLPTSSLPAHSSMCLLAVALSGKTKRTPFAPNTVFRVFPLSCTRARLRPCWATRPATMPRPSGNCSHQHKNNKRLVGGSQCTKKNASWFRVGFLHCKVVHTQH